MYYIRGSVKVRLKRYDTGVKCNYAMIEWLMSLHLLHSIKE